MLNEKKTILTVQGKLEKPAFRDGGRVFPVRTGKNALTVEKWPLGYKWPNY